MAGGLTVVAASAYAAINAVGAFREMRAAQKGQQESAIGLDQSKKETAESFRTFVIERVENGKLELTEKEAETLDFLIDQKFFEAARKMVQERLPAGEVMSDAEKAAAVSGRIGGLKQGFEFDDAVRNTSERNAGQINTEADRTREIDRVQERSVRLVNEYNALKKGLYQV